MTGRAESRTGSEGHLLVTKRLQRVSLELRDTES